MSEENEELIVERVDKSFHGMNTNTLTVAELLLHLGYVLPPDPGRSAADTEQILEDTCFNLQRIQYQGKPLDGAPDIHTYLLSNPQDAEVVFFESWRVDEHHKIAVARFLERQYGWSRKQLFNKTTPQLQAAIRTGDCPPGYGAPVHGADIALAHGPPAHGAAIALAHGPVAHDPPPHVVRRRMRGKGPRDG